MRKLSPAIAKDNTATQGCDTSKATLLYYYHLRLAVFFEHKVRLRSWIRQKERVHPLKISFLPQQAFSSALFSYPLMLLNNNQQGFKALVKLGEG